MDFDIKTLESFYKMLEVKEGVKLCAYCGARATDREHVVPKINFHQDGKPHLQYHLHINNLVWSCHECNILAGTTTVKNFWEKKQHICERIKSKYRKLLTRKPWTPKEISELRGKVKAQVYCTEKFKEQLLARLENLEKPEICGDIERSDLDL